MRGGGADRGPAGTATDGRARADDPYGLYSTGRGPAGRRWFCSML